jgi:DNA (cytosine-5)-methyltransferase 1
MTKVAALCSGYGGIELGLAMVEDIDVIWHAEIEPAPATIHQHHWPDAPNVGDISVADWAAFERPDLLTAGYPCQPFSTAGRRKGSDDPRHLWPHVATAVRVLRPRRVLLENVAGHRTLGFGTVLADLAAMGYDVRWGCVRASDAGAPHRRERLFIAAANPQDVGHERRWGARRRGHGPEDGGHAAADTDVTRPQGQESARRRDLPARCGRQPVAWGPHEPAIRRWEHLTRPAPRPTDDRGRLSPAFVEWMMGLPADWVTGHGLPRTAELKMLGNGVVPQAAALAWAHLNPDRQAIAA